MHTLRIAVPLALAASLAAQSVTVPAEALVGPPNQNSWWSSQLFYSTSSTTVAHDSRTQLIYDVSNIPVASAVWNSVSVRRPGKGGNSYLGNSNPAVTTNGTIMMSVSPMAWNSTATNFAGNHGSTPITVFTGMISLPAQPAQNIWPFPWETPIPFNTPFPYVAASGSTLVFDLLQTGNTSSSSWYVEAYNRDLGARSENGGPQSTCKFSNGAYNSGLGYNSPYLGSNWLVNYQGGLPANMPAVGALGSQGVGGTWAGVPLPIDLTPFGAPGCRWTIDVVVTSALQVVGTSMNIYQWPNLTVPNDPGIVGANFFDQALFVDPPANAAGLVVSWPSKWTVGSGQGAKARQVSSTGNAAATAISGSNSPGLGVSLMFN